LLFEYLAFCDDWRFFAGRSSFKGVSLTSIAFSAVRSLVIFLYLYDADTSSIILFSVGKDVLYNAWKLARILRVEVRLVHYD
jgi:hypothetical protein